MGRILVLTIPALAGMQGLGDATWSVSTGIGSILVSGIYEVGRPDRLGAEEAEELQKIWSDFCE